MIKPVDFDFFKRLNPVSSNFYLFKISKLSPINYIIKNNSSFVNFSFIVNNTSNINSFEILLDEKMVKVVNLNKNKIEFSLQTYGAKFMEIIVVIDDLKSKDQWTTSLIKYKIE